MKDAATSRQAAIPAATGLSEVCYKRIGVYGDGSCPELIQHIHCRNCPVFASAAQALLDRELPTDYRASSTSHYSRPILQNEEELVSAVLFRVGHEWLALPPAVIEEVQTLRPVHSLPHRQSGVVLGVANVRGELITCVSLARVLGARASLTTHPTPAATSYARLLLLHRAATRFVTPVDEVHGMYRYSESERVPPPATLGKAAGTFTAGVLSWRGNAVGCLDDELLFHYLERNLG